MAGRVSISVDVALFTPRGNELATLLIASDRVNGRRHQGWSLPSDGLRRDESLDQAAARIASAAVGGSPSFLDQAAALGGSLRAGGNSAHVAVAYFGVVPVTSASAPENVSWIGISELQRIGARCRQEIDVALTAMRTRLEQRPIAFRLLPQSFTLSELQTVYELLLGRTVHKASFRRSLHSAALVEATDQWRSEGRGRPARLFRYAPSRRRDRRGGVRFDLIST